MKGFFDLLIGDEVHEFKGRGSAQGIAAGILTPLMRPYVVLKGIQDGFISQEDVMRFEYTENGRLVKPYQPSLFND